MKKHLNTLFVTLEGCWLSKDGDTVKVKVLKVDAELKRISLEVVH